MGSTVVDNPPAILTGVTWTCTAAGGASCPASGAGDINETVDLPVGGSVEFLLSGTVDPGAGGWLINEAAVTPPAGAIDPTPYNASMRDWDALEPAIFCDSFDGGVAQRNRSDASGAVPLQKQVTDDGYIFDSTDTMTALRATGCGCYQIKIFCCRVFR